MLIQNHPIYTLALTASFSLQILGLERMFPNQNTDSNQNSIRKHTTAVKLQLDPSRSISLATCAGIRGVSPGNTCFCSRGITQHIDIIVDVVSSKTDHITMPPKNNPNKQNIVLLNHTTVPA